MAPSPTGYFHVGGARTALYNWLVARGGGGSFILRIDDTDADRSREEWVRGIEASMRWLGLDWDEGPVRQSQRKQLYERAAARLLADSRAYYCDCTREDIEARTKGRAVPGYDGHCRDRGLGPGPGRAMRFRVPDEGITVVEDLVRGRVEFSNSTIEDFVIVKSSGDPLFLLATAVDDIDLEITHVVRGEEHLPSTPKGVLLWRALGGPELPMFAHLPILVNERRQKLSKRRDRLAVEDYRDAGYLPAAMRNYLALLGWSPPSGRELMATEEMIASFDLTHVNSSPAFFDVRKLTHFNGEYIRAMPPSEFVEACSRWLERVAWDEFDPKVFAAIAPLVQARVSTLSEVPGMVDFLFLDRPQVDQGSWAKAISENPQAAAVLDGVLTAYEECDWRADAIRSATASVGEGMGLKLSKAQAPVRVAVTGRSVGPPLFESLELLGRERALGRVRAARQSLAA
jgi:glutamyl-tRNA synthetase